MPSRFRTSSRTFSLIKFFDPKAHPNEVRVRNSVSLGVQEFELIKGRQTHWVELIDRSYVLEGHWILKELIVAKKTKKKIVRREYTKDDIKLLRAHSKARTPVAKLAKLTRRTEGSLRQKALKLGIGLGHQR